MYIRKYKCPFCDKRYEKNKLASHIDRVHNEMIPGDIVDSNQLVFNYINKKTHGTCVVCGNKTEWDEKLSKYKRLCYNQKCRQTLRDRAKNNMIRVHGKVTLLNDPEHQKKMLANRSISGEYRFRDGTKFIYTGSYEKNAIEFMDKVLQLNSKDIMMPGPTIEYVDSKGNSRSWITDIYFIPYNLIIEVKDGGKNPNNRVMEEYRDKQVAKELELYKLNTYNYLRLTDNNFAQLLEAFIAIRNRMEDGDDLSKKDKSIQHFHKVNESFEEVTSLDDIRNMLIK